MVASSCLRLSTSPARTVAASVSATWCAIRSAISGRKLQREMQDLVALPVDESEIDAGRDCADLVPDPVRGERRLRVVEDDRLLLVEPAGVFVDLRADGLDPERKDLVAELALLGVEHLSFPDHEVDQLRRRPLEPGAGRDQDGALGLAARDLAGFATSEEGVELVPRQLEQLRHVDSHSALPSTAVRNRPSSTLPPLVPASNLAARRGLTHLGGSAYIDSAPGTPPVRLGVAPRRARRGRPSNGDSKGAPRVCLARRSRRSSTMPPRRWTSGSAGPACR